MTGIWTPARLRGGGREAGSATVLGAAMVAVLVLCLAGVAGLLSAVEASHRARAAADLAALAAATTLLDPMAAGRSPCAVAANIARSNGGRLHDCATRGDVVTLSVRVSAALPVIGSARATARAGPATRSMARGE